MDVLVDIIIDGIVIVITVAATAGVAITDVAIAIDIAITIASNSALRWQEQGTDTPPSDVRSREYGVRTLLLLSGVSGRRTLSPLAAL